MEWTHKALRNSVRHLGGGEGGSSHQTTQEAAQQAQANDHGQHQHKEQPGPKGSALDLVLWRAEVLVNAFLVFGIQAAGHTHLEKGMQAF